MQVERSCRGKERHFNIHFEILISTLRFEHPRKSLIIHQIGIMAVQAMWIRDNMLGERNQHERQLTEAELKVQRSLQKLSIPDWYLNKRSKSPKILRNDVPFERRLSSWRNTFADEKPADQPSRKQRDNTDSPTKQKAQVDEKEIQGISKSQKVPRDAHLSTARKSPSKSSSKHEKFDTEVPKVVLSKNISKTFPKVSPSRKIQNINIVFPPASQIDTQNSMNEQPKESKESKYSTFVLKKRFLERDERDGIDELEKIEDSSWKMSTEKSTSPYDPRNNSFDTSEDGKDFERRTVSSQKYSTKDCSTIADGSKDGDDSSWTTLVEEFDRRVTLNSTWTTPTKRSARNSSNLSNVRYIEESDGSIPLNSTWTSPTKKSEKITSNPSNGRYAKESQEPNPLNSTWTNTMKKSSEDSWNSSNVMYTEESDLSIPLTSTWKTPTKKCPPAKQSRPAVPLNSSWTKSTKEFHSNDNTFCTPDAKNSFKLRAVSTPKYSSPDYLSSTFSEDTSKLSNCADGSMMEKSSQVEKDRRLGRSSIPGIHAIEPIFFEKKKDDEEAPAEFSTSVRDLVKELDAKNPRLLGRKNVELKHSPSTRFLTCRRKSTVLETIVKSKQTEQKGRGLIMERIKELNRQCSVESEKKHEVTTNTQNFVKNLVRTLEKRGTLGPNEASRSTEEEEDLKPRESKVGGFHRGNFNFTSVKRTEDTSSKETNVKSKIVPNSESRKWRETGISRDSNSQSQLTPTLPSFNKNINGKNLDKFEAKSTSSSTSMSFDKKPNSLNPNQLEIKSPSPSMSSDKETESKYSNDSEIKSSPSSTSMSFYKETESGSSSEAEAKSTLSSASISFKETDSSSSDSDQRSPASKDDECERFEFETPRSEAQDAKEEGSCEEEDSVYWIPVSRCELPRSSSLLSMMSRMSLFGQSPCVSPIRKQPDDGWGLTFEKSNEIPSSKRLFKIDEMAVTDSGYSDRSDRSGANSSAGFLAGETTWLEEDNRCESKSSRFKRSSARRKTIVGQRTFLV